MSTGRGCTKCASRCFFITLKCLFDQSTLLDAHLDTNKVTKHLDGAQIKYLKQPLGDCFKEICDAIKDFEDNQVAIEQRWIDLIDMATMVIVDGTEYLYVRKSGYAILTKEGLKFPQKFEEGQFEGFVSGLKIAVEESLEMFKIWLQDNKSLYPCLPTDDCLLKENDSSALSSWGTVKPDFGGRFDVDDHPHHL